MRFKNQNYRSVFLYFDFSRRFRLGLWPGRAGPNPRQLGLNTRVTSRFHSPTRDIYVILSTAHCG